MCLLVMLCLVADQAGKVGSLSPISVARLAKLRRSAWGMTSVRQAIITSTRTHDEDA